MAVREGQKKDGKKKCAYGRNYRRNRDETQFDTLTLAHELKHKVSMYVMNEARVPKKWRYMNGKHAIDYAAGIRWCVLRANDLRLDGRETDGEDAGDREKLQKLALSYCNVLELQLSDICRECDGATEESMQGITDDLYKLRGKITNWRKSDNDRLGK